MSVNSFLNKLFGDPNKKALKEIQPLVETINSLESEFEKLTDQELKNKTQEFKNRLQEGQTLDDILPEAFATVRETSKRTMGMRHYDVQLIGGIALHQGKIAEMRTGEGKTLVATLPTYLNALEGKGVHVVTVNDYLAKRDAVWMSKIYDFLGLSVGIIQNQRVSYKYVGQKLASENEKLTESEINDIEIEEDSFKIDDDFIIPCSRQEAYRLDIVYGTNNEFGFDYLRDNMVQSLDEMVMRPGEEMHYAIIDEVDSILIDEARTPLIISAPAEQATEQYYQFAKLVRGLKENEDYNVDEKMRSSTLTEEGIAKFEKWLNVENLYVEGGIRLVHHIEQALKAEVLFKRDKDYIVENNEVIIIDEFTGRKMPGRRYSEGLHQAIEAKENVAIQRESQTLATITFQNLFRMYNKLSGMTGTASTEAEEFGKIYNLEVVTIPTNRPDVRKDLPDRIYRSEKGKNKAIIEKIKECQEKQQPVLIGTISVEKNEELSAYLTLNGIQHELLNAKNHEREAEIVAQAGRPGAVTLATNMAGRGVDIKLGGNPIDKEEEKIVKEAGGLFVLGTERHESRRIDNQLRGRAARQGDPGETQFFISTEDELVRVFAGDRLKSAMNFLKVPEDFPIEQKSITRIIESAQKKVEGFHFDNRKHVLEYDDVLNRHRDVIYKRRKQILNLAANFDNLKKEEKIIETKTNLVLEEEKNYNSLQEIVFDLIEQEIELVVSFHTNTEDKSQWNMQEIYETARTIFPFSQEEREILLHFNRNGNSKLEDVEVRNKIVEFLLEKAQTEYNNVKIKIESLVPADEKEKAMNEIEKNVLLRSIDNLWVNHLVEIDYLRTGIGLRGYGQRDPLVEYKKETFFMFNNLLANIQKEVVYSFFKVGAGIQLAPTVMANDRLILQGAQKTMNESGQVERKPRDESGKKIGRNDPCPCGSGKKYKKCCGK
ncbi:MAG: preprotein translocase subunit SecA [Patescibacteria group bacterium]|jgi:preprotein translocase subunit SecA|nr:preprotein translocase subunit SecA [Candidatus Magasanikbacteria bacterium]